MTLAFAHLSAIYHFVVYASRRWHYSTEAAIWGTTVECSGKRLMMRLYFYMYGHRLANYSEICTARAYIGVCRNDMSRLTIAESLWSNILQLCTNVIGRGTEDVFIMMSVRAVTNRKMSAGSKPLSPRRILTRHFAQMLAGVGRHGRHRHSRHDCA